MNKAGYIPALSRLINAVEEADKQVDKVHEII